MEGSNQNWGRGNPTPNRRDYNDIVENGTVRVANGEQVGEHFRASNARRDRSLKRQIPPQSHPVDNYGGEEFVGDNLNNDLFGAEQYENVQQMPNNIPPVNDNVTEEQSSKKSKKKVLLGGVVLVAVLGLVVFVKLKGVTPKAVSQGDYATSGKKAYDTLLENLHSYDAVAVDDCVGEEEGDSYLAQEWAYVNVVKLREELITKVTGLVDFKYPAIEVTSADGTVITDKDGKAKTEQSLMNNGEKVIVTIPDYAKITEDMETNREYILQLFQASGYSKKDYTWNDEMANLLCQYVVDLEEIPLTEVELNLPVKTGKKPIVTDDSELDMALFSSDEFHGMCAKFSQICVGYTGFKDEKYLEKEEQENPEYKRWYKLFEKYYNADNGKFHKGVSKWEPWYVRDDENNIQYDKNGKKLVNYYTVKDKNGKDWIEPEKTVMVDVEKVRQVEDVWVEETAITYAWIGTYYVQNLYEGAYDTTIRVGDGSIEHPAGIGTPIITKVLCKDGKYHDVKVALVGYWTKDDAINYAEKFDTRNRGFTSVSVVQLITYEIKVTNLENNTIEFESEMVLSDKNSNLSTRTGTMYGFSETVKLAKGNSIIINDWASSTELDQKYVIWGKSFGRAYPMVYFDALAGTGDIPTYSAYTYFTGKSSIDGSIEITPSENGSNNTNTHNSTDIQSTASATNSSSGSEQSEGEVLE